MASLNKEIVAALKPILPVAWHHYPGTPPDTYGTFFTYNQRGNNFADNTEVDTAYSVQIDIYSKVGLETVVEQVKAALEPLGYTRTSEIEMFNVDTKVYRKSLSFSLSREKE